MKNYTREERKKLFNSILNKHLKNYRTRHNITQERAAELLDMSVRSYVSHESSNSGFQGITTANFLLSLSPEELSDFRREYWESVHGDSQ